MIKRLIFTLAACASILALGFFIIKSVNPDFLAVDAPVEEEYYEEDDLVAGEVADLDVTVELVRITNIANGRVELQYRYVIRNSIGITVTNITAINSLVSAFSPYPFDITNISISGGTLNPGFNGIGNTSLLTGSDSLANGASIVINITVRFDPAGSQGPFENAVSARGVYDRTPVTATRTTTSGSSNRTSTATSSTAARTTTTSTRATTPTTSSTTNRTTTSTAPSRTTTGTATETSRTSSTTGRTTSGTSTNRTTSNTSPTTPTVSRTTTTSQAASSAATSTTGTSTSTTTGTTPGNASGSGSVAFTLPPGQAPIIQSSPRPGSRNFVK